MKKLKLRSLIVILFAMLVVSSLALLGFNLYSDGSRWASYQANGNVYHSGKLVRGEIKDRNGEFLAKLTADGIEYSENKLTREATLHIIGDREGNIAHSAGKEFRSELIGWNLIDGVNTKEGTVNSSISASAEKTAYTAMKGRKGAVAVIDYSTGEIICAVSSPSFDPENKPEILPDGAYVNRAVGASYTPGSVFKIITLAAAIDNIPDLYDRDFNCEGSVKIGGGTVTCTRKHGMLKIEDAMAVSCNCVFAELSVELGNKDMQSYADKLGITKKIDFKGGTISAGKYTGSSSDDIALAWSGVGQSDDLVVPMTLARICAAIANGGSVNKLSLLKNDNTEIETLFSEETAEKLSDVLAYNVIHTYGENNFPGLNLRAKSGTAEVGGNKAPNSWFCGFIDNEGAKYAFAVVVEEGGWGIGAAADVAREVLISLKDNMD